MLMKLFVLVRLSEEKAFKGRSRHSTLESTLKEFLQKIKTYLFKVYNDLI